MKDTATRRTRFQAVSKEPERGDYHSGAVETANFLHCTFNSALDAKLEEGAADEEMVARAWDPRDNSLIMKQFTVEIVVTEEIAEPSEAAPTSRKDSVHSGLGWQDGMLTHLAEEAKATALTHEGNVTVAGLADEAIAGAKEAINEDGNDCV